MFFAHLALNANVVRENLKNGGECAGHSAETEAKAAKGVRHAQVQLAPRDRKLLPGSQEVQGGVRRACNTGWRFSSLIYREADFKIPDKPHPAMVADHRGVRF